MKIEEKIWARFGRWMAICSGLIFLIMAFYNKDDFLSLLLRLWSGAFGLYCVYVGFTK